MLKISVEDPPEVRPERTYTSEEVKATPGVFYAVDDTDKVVVTLCCWGLSAGWYNTRNYITYWFKAPDQAKELLNESRKWRKLPGNYHVTFRNEEEE